jgi:hypothetical protein
MIDLLANECNEGEPALPFPTRPLVLIDRIIEEYIIPEEKKAEVLKQLYPFSPVPALTAKMLDIHEDKTFRVRDFRVTRENNRNWLVSPYYHLSGGTVIDWFPT